MYVGVVLKSKTRLTDKIYSYKVLEKYEGEDLEGRRVLVPFGRGNKTRVGLVVESYETLDSKFEIKEILDVIDEKSIASKEMLEIAKFMRKTYLSDLSSAIRTVLPPVDIVNISEYYRYTDPNMEGFFTEERTKDQALKGGFSKEELERLVEDGVIAIGYDLRTNVSRNIVTYYEYVNKDGISNRAFLQKNIIDFIEDRGITSRKNILEVFQTGGPAIKSLIERGNVKVILKEELRRLVEKNTSNSRKELRDYQREVFDDIETSSYEKPFLIHGVTGSGKTEIYLSLAEKVIAEGKKVIVLVPEISLTPQTIKRFQERFDRVAVYHSKLSFSEKFDQWRLIKENKVDIVVGTRSAIFSPFKDLGLIIIDEEHELSFISDKNPKYDALEIAKFRMEYNKAKLVLGSATPRISSYYEAKLGKYKLYSLKERATGASLPKVEMVDMRLELMEKNYSMLSRRLKEEMEKSLSQKKQAILFINKRGHTSFIFCRKCGYVLKCEACDSSMTYHKNKNISICHFCGRTKEKPIICPSCGSKFIKEFGAGTEKLEEIVREEFPQARVARMDRDTMIRKGSYDRIYEDMKDGKIDILIGTQMLSKGFDFENVNLVGIVSSDISLNVPDYRANERTFQLLTQVAGRSGRLSEGNVILQTYQPNNEVLKAASQHDYESFYDFEIKTREKLKYPPFYDLVLLRVMHEKRLATFDKALEIAKILGGELGGRAEIIGPNPSVVERINNWYRFNIIIKTDNYLEDVKEVIESKVLENESFTKGDYRLYYMTNPLSFY